MTRAAGVFALLAALSLPGCDRVPGVRAPAAVSPDRAFREHRLSNGLRVVVGERRGSGLVATTVFVDAGARWEPDALSGAAHFLEHLLFNGTTTRTQERLYADVDRIGAYNNASTRKDHAIFMMLVGVDSAREGLDIQSDMLFRSTLPEAKFGKEKGIVLEEIAKDRAKPTYPIELARDAVLYAGTPYARPVLGTEASIGGLEREAVLAYYRARYRPEHMMLLVLGDLSEAEMMGLVRDTFGRAPQRPRPHDAAPEAEIDATGFMPPAIEGWRVVHAPFAHTEREVLLRVPAPLPGEYGYTELDLMTALLARGEGSRLRRAMDIRPRLETNSLAAGLTVVGGRGYLDLAARTPADTDPDAVVARMAGELARLAREEVGGSELAAAKIARRAEEASLREKIHYYGMMRGDVLRHADLVYLDSELARQRAVSPADVRAAAKRWVRKPPALVYAIGPGLEARDESRSARAIGFEAPSAELPGDPSFDVPDPRPPRRAPAATGPERVRLENGMTLVLQVDPTSDILAVHLAALGRSHVEPEGKAGIADMLHRLLVRGAGKMKRTKLGARLEAIGASVKTHDDGSIPYDDYYTSPDFSFVRFETLDDFHAEAFELLGTMVTRPRLDRSEIDAVRREMLAEIRAAGENPTVLADLAFREILYGETSPAARPIGGDEASIESIDRRDLERFHARYFSPENLVLAVVTGLPREEVVSAAESAFEVRGRRGDPLEPFTERDARPDLRARPVRVEKALDGAQSRVVIGYPFDVAPADVPALTATNLLLSDRMAFHLRERLGIAYTLGSSFRTWDGRGLLVAEMGTRSENLERAEAGLLAQIDSMRVVSIDPDALERAVAARNGRLRMRRITRMGQAYYLTMDVLAGDEPGAHERRLLALRGVTPEDVRRVSERYLDASRASRVVVR